MDRLDVFGSLLSRFDRLTTQAVVDEIRERDAEAHAVVTKADWLRVVPTGGLDFLVAYSTWGRRMGLKDDHDIGETTLCAYAEIHGGTVVLDDCNARKVAELNGLTVRGTVGLIADACRCGEYPVAGASSLVDDLHDSGMRLPFARGGFEGWCREKRLL